MVKQKNRSDNTVSVTPEVRLKTPEVSLETRA